MVPYGPTTLHGVGVVAVNALSEWFEIETSSDAQGYRLRCERGMPTGPVEPLGPAESTGIMVRFKPDPSIFAPATVDPARFVRRVQEVAAGVPGCVIRLEDRRILVFSTTDGVVELLRPLRSSSIHPPISARGRYESVDVDVAVTLGSVG